jgi:glycosyltransferase involved in cell wall biosynthesis
MACGTPVLTTTGGSLPEVSGDAALLVDPEEPDAFVDAILEVLTTPEVADRLTARGLENVKRFSWQDTAAQTVAVYDEVLAST